jgi:hypothetical protein
MGKFWPKVPKLLSSRFCITVSDDRRSVALPQSLQAPSILTLIKIDQMGSWEGIEAVGGCLSRLARPTNRGDDDTDVAVIVGTSLRAHEELYM